MLIKKMLGIHKADEYLLGIRKFNNGIEEIALLLNKNYGNFYDITHKDNVDYKTINYYALLTKYTTIEKENISIQCAKNLAKEVQGNFYKDYIAHLQKQHSEKIKSSLQM